MENASWEWLRDNFERPSKRFNPSPEGAVQPPSKAHITQILPHIAGLRTDEQLRQYLQRWHGDTVLVNFGSSWCHHCHQMFPHFLSLSKQFRQLKYAVAQVDYMHEETRGITYTPTFAIYKKGRKVDQFFGANEQQLRDHMWLWTRQTGSQDGST